MENLKRILATISDWLSEGFLERFGREEPSSDREDGRDHSEMGTIGKRQNLRWQFVGKLFGGRAVLFCPCQGRNWGETGKQPVSPRPMLIKFRIKSISFAV